MFIAISAGLAAGALWALSFIAPGLVRPFAASDLTLARFAVFGISSIFLLSIWPKDRWLPIAKSHWRALLILALSGNTLYYLLLSEALQHSGVLLPTLVIGTLPVVMALVGGLRTGQFSLRRFIVPSGLILSGLAIHVGSLTSIPATAASSTGPLIGFALAVAALVSWAFYGLWNAELLAANRGIDLVGWTALTGIATTLMLPPFALFLPGAGFSLLRMPFAYIAPLLFWGMVLGILSSWLATWLWNKASRALSGEFLGYLIVSETMFAVLYAFILELRLPILPELLSIGLLVAGVVLGIRGAGRADRVALRSS